MAHRSPARWLAPLALVTCAVAVWAVVGAGSGSDGGPSTGGSSTTATGPRTSTSPAAGTTTVNRRARSRTGYTVKPGDTPSAIAATLGVTVQQLLEANPGVDAQTLRVGQRLKLPR